MGDRRGFAFVGNRVVGELVAERLANAGLTPVENVGSADVVFTYCTSQTSLEDTYFDDNGLVQVARPGTLLVDLSPATPTFARELNAVALVNDLSAVEAPLVVVDPLRPDAFASASNLACFVAGEDAAVEEACELLSLFVGAPCATGGAGSAQLARAGYTLQATAQIVAAIEAEALYRVFRTAPTSFGQVEGGVGAATPLAEQVLEAVAAERFEGAFSIEMLMGELSAALMAADDLDLILPQAESAQRLLELLAVIGGSDKGVAALSLLYREEEECAANGLDWSRAEQVYGDDGCDDDDCDCGHSHGRSYGRDDDDGYPGYPDYSFN